MSDGPTGPTGREAFTVRAEVDERGARVAPFCLRCRDEVQATPGEVFQALSIADLDALADHHNLKVHGELPESSSW